MMNWLGEKIVILYALGAVIIVGVIWIIGEIRLYLRTRHCKPKKAKQERYKQK